MAVTKLNLGTQIKAIGAAVGDIYYVSDTDGTLTKLVANTTTTKKVLQVTGTGAAGQAPSWTAGPINIGTSAPANPSVGDLWIDTN